MPNISHISGHQDKKKQYADLAVPAKANIDADTLTGNFINHQQ